MSVLPLPPGTAVTATRLVLFWILVVSVLTTVGFGVLAVGVGVLG